MAARRGRAAFLVLLAGQVVAYAEVRGRVLVDDGMPPVTLIHVELRCEGAETVKTAAGPDGRFTFAARDDRHCTVTASLPGYIPDTIPIRSLPLDPDIGGLALRRDGKWQGYALSVTTLAASEKALASFAEGVIALRAGGQANMAKAELLFARAGKEDTQFAEAWFQLGRLRLSRGDVTAARTALTSSLTADPWFISPYRPLLMLELADERWSAARALCEQWLRLAPQSADARFYSALSALELEDLPAARANLLSIETGPESDSFAPVHYLRGRIFEREGRTIEALAEYRNYLAAEPDGVMANEARERLAKAKSP